MKTKLFAFVLVVCVIFSATLPVSAATPIYKEDIDDIRLHQEELWKVMREILRRLSTI